VSSWAPGVDPVTSWIRLTGDRSGARIQTCPVLGDWSWLQAEYSDASSRLVFCGAGVIKHWDSSPVPRHLLAHILLEPIPAAGPAAE
jgi:hypothetical protein